MRCVDPILALSLGLVCCSRSSGKLVPQVAQPAAPAQAQVEAPAATAAKPSDAIDQLVARLSAEPLWQNGVFPHVLLPADATIPEVVAEVLAHVGFDQGKVTSHRVLATRNVAIGMPDERYTAVLLSTNLGKKIMLLRGPMAGGNGWWSRVHDVPDGR
jgi:hypothetical protein